MEHEAQYGSIEEVESRDDSHQIAAFKRTSVVLLLLCGTIAGAGLFVMGQHAAVGGGASVFDIQSQDDDVLPAPAPEAETDAPAEAVADGEAAPALCPLGQEGLVGAECADCPVARYKEADGATMCDSCPAGKTNDVPGASYAASCGSCTTGHFCPEGEPPQKWTECAGGGSVDTGVTRQGSATEDVSCDNCVLGKNTLRSNSADPCFKMTDLDGDGLYDRIPTGWEHGMPFDERESPPSGGEFDKCPFDVDNDIDGDGICGGVPPLASWREHLEEHGEAFYTPGGWHVDQCPFDANNNADKDRKCDKGGSVVDNKMVNSVEDDNVVSWDFYSKSAGLVGWADKQEQFEIAHDADDVLPALDERRFLFDERVMEICEKSVDVVEAMFSITRGRFDWTEMPCKELTDAEVDAGLKREPCPQESVHTMYAERAVLVAAWETEKDEEYRTAQWDVIQKFDLSIVDEKDKVAMHAHNAKHAVHVLEAEADKLQKELSNKKILAAIAEDESAANNDLSTLSQKLTQKLKQIKTQQKLLPGAIATMQLKNFLPPTCEKLCLDHNLVCEIGQIVERFVPDPCEAADADDSCVPSAKATARDQAEEKIAAVRENLHQLLKEREEREMWYEQARIKSEAIGDEKERDEHVVTKRAGELKGDLKKWQTKIEAAEGEKKALEAQLSTCNPVNEGVDAQRKKIRDDKITDEIAIVNGELSGLNLRRNELKAAIKSAKDNEQEDKLRVNLELKALIDHEIEALGLETENLEHARTGCMDQAEDSSSNLQCRCGAPKVEDVVSVEEWSGDEVCTTCFARSSTAASTGMMGAGFKVKKNTVRFAMQGNQALGNFVKLTILDKGQPRVIGKMPGQKVLEGRPSFQETVSNHGHLREADGEEEEPLWYPVEWDLSEYVGRDAYVQVAHMQANDAMFIDEFEFFNDHTGCLPTCMAIRDGVCNNDETCFYFENDVTPYIEVKSTGHGTGQFCRASTGGGTELGGGISHMGYDYADWTDEHPDIITLLAERAQMVLDHDKEKADWMQKEKDRGKTTDWMMNSSEMSAELAKIDAKWEEKYIKKDKEISDKRREIKDLANGFEKTKDEQIALMAATYVTQCTAQQAIFDMDMNEEDEDGNMVYQDDDQWDAAMAVHTDLIASLPDVRKGIQEIRKQAQDEFEALVGEDSGWAGSTMDFLSIRKLPRCFNLEMRGSHYAISLPAKGSTLWAYEPEPSLGNGSVDGVHCVFNSIKPRCLAISKGSAGFEKNMRATCKEDLFEGTCYNQCERFFCSSDYDKDGNGNNDQNDRDACGKDDGESPGAFDRCANCCGRLNSGEGWSSCLTRRRRRRLREAVKTFNAEGDEDHHYSRHECAEACLSSDGCIAFDTREGACIISSDCHSHDGQGEGDGFRTGKWYVKLGTPNADLGLPDVIKPKKRRVRKNKPSAYEKTDEEKTEDIVAAMDEIRESDMSATEQHEALLEQEADRVEVSGDDTNKVTGAVDVQV